MLDKDALYYFKREAGLSDEEIFVKFHDDQLSPLDSERAAALLEEPWRVVLDFYRGDGTHLGFVDGGYWEVQPHITPSQREETIQRNREFFGFESNATSFQPSSSLGQRLMRLAQNATNAVLKTRLP